MRSILLTFFCVASLYCFADPGARITGENVVTPGATKEYLAEFDAPLHPYTYLIWSVTGGTIIYQNINPTNPPFTCIVQWDNNDGEGTISVYEDLGGQGAELRVFRETESASSFCDGFLGAPTVSINFGSGNNPGPPLPNGVTTYRYRNVCAIESNDYAIRSNTLACRNVWYEIPEDHTPNDVNGYFMMVDADDSRGEFYRTSVTGLMPNFKYEFSAWVGNIDNSPVFQSPKITFEVYANGNLIGSSGILTVPFSSPFTWGKVGFTIDIPPGVTTVEVVIVNANRSTGGNDLVLDDIAFSPCYPKVQASFSDLSIIQKEYACLSGSVNLFAKWPSIIPFVNPSYKWERSIDGINWSPLSGATTINFTTSEATIGIYYYRVISYETNDPSKSVTSDPITFYVQKLIVDPQTFNVLACNTSNQELNPSFYMQYSDPFGPTFNYSYAWSPSTYLSNSQIRNPVISLPQLSPPSIVGPPVAPVTYTYNLSIQNTSLNCGASSTITVVHRNPRKVAIPSGFTPDGNGNNDYYYPLNLEDYPGAKFWVFNRWGNQVFYSEGPDFRWNGTVGGVPQGTNTFVFQIYMPVCPNNIISAGPMTTNGNYHSGNFQLVR